jgi:osmotically-inducible protein OsmY
MKNQLVPLRPLRPLAALMLLFSFSACSLFRSTEKVVNKIEKIEQKATQPEQKKEPEPSHEGPLLDNKVTALRVQDALRKAGPQFDGVQVEGTKESVVLTGTVRSSTDSARAEEIARGVHRAMKLRNELRVGK